MVLVCFLALRHLNLAPPKQPIKQRLLHTPQRLTTPELQDLLTAARRELMLEETDLQVIILDTMVGCEDMAVGQDLRA